MSKAHQMSRWRIVIAMVQLETVIALVAGIACYFGKVEGATLATLLVGLLGTSRVPAAVRVMRGEPDRRDDDDENDPPSTNTPPSLPSKSRRATTIVLTSCILTLAAGFWQWRKILQRGA